MTTTVKALQKLSIQTFRGRQALDEFTVEPGESFDLLTGNDYRTEVEPMQLVLDRSLADLGFGDGDPRAAGERIERYINHIAAGRDLHTSLYGRLYE